ncbi:hypothetical protein ACIP5Y_15655 [Nocardia sp. NPDC088792]|uniref:hypothetical protein n=1 Tax=Nocardia sp. NPDC088792 TaxID=3364332 RepID=UPI0038038F97
MPNNDIHRDIVQPTVRGLTAPVQPRTDPWSMIGSVGSTILKQILGERNRPTIRFIDDDGGDNPDLPDQSVLGRLPQVPDDATRKMDPLHPGYEEPGGDYIHGQPKHGTDKYQLLVDPSLYADLKIAGSAIQDRMAAEGWHMAARLMHSFMNNNSSALQLTNNETQEAVFDTRWGRSALFYGQNVRWDPSNDHDPRHEPELWTAPAPSDMYPHQAGILDDANKAIQDVHDGKYNYGDHIPMVVGWLRTPADADNKDNQDVQFALGHFHEGADGYIQVNKGAPGQPDTYEVHFQAKEWDHYKFDDQPITFDNNGKRDIGHFVNLTANEFMRLAHSVGVAENYIDYGSTGDIDASGVAGSSDINYSFRDDPEHQQHTMTMQQHYATGGPISAGDVKGPGSSIGDKIPAFLSDGEFVVNAASANANRPLLKAINDDPLYMNKYVQHMEQMVAAALTKVKAAPNQGAGDHVDQSMTVHISAYDVHGAFAKAKLWEQRRALIDA